MRLPPAYVVVATVMGVDVTEEKMQAALAEARHRLDAAIHKAMRRPLTPAQAAEFKALERLVAKLSAKLGMNRLPRGPRRPKLEAEQPIWPASKLRLVTK